VFASVTGTALDEANVRKAFNRNAHWLADASSEKLVDALDDAAPHGPQTAPTACDEGDQGVLSALNGVVSRVGIAPERRGRRTKPERLRITRRNHVERCRPPSLKLQRTTFARGDVRWLACQPKLAHKNRRAKVGGLPAEALKHQERSTVAASSSSAAMVDSLRENRERRLVSRVGIAPERRSRRLKPERLRITRRNHVERRETW
jgi:hypothetical protein